MLSVQTTLTHDYYAYLVIFKVDTDFLPTLRGKYVFHLDISLVLILMKLTMFCLQHLGEKHTLFYILMIPDIR